MPHDIGKFKKFMRVKCYDIVGEIIDIRDDELIVNYTDEVVAGWNNESKYKEVAIKSCLCTPLDNGLNSAWWVLMDKIKELV